MSCAAVGTFSFDTSWSRVAIIGRSRRIGCGGTGPRGTAGGRIRALGSHCQRGTSVVVLRTAGKRIDFGWDDGFWQQFLNPMQERDRA